MSVFDNVKYIKLYFKISPIIDREKELFKMKLTTSTFCQMLLGVCDILNVVTPILQGSGKIYAGAGLAILHIVVNTISHVSNPDGTNVELAYTPPPVKDAK